MQAQRRVIHLGTSKSYDSVGAKVDSRQVWTYIDTIIRINSTIFFRN